MLESVDFSAEALSKEEFKPAYKQLVRKLVVLQQEARKAGIGLVVLFEGWGGAGKGSRISDLMYELDARAASVHVTPDFDTKALRDFPGLPWGVTGYYPVMQEFWQALGERGTMTFYDRGWYTAAIDQALFEIACDGAKKPKKKAKGASADLGATLLEGAAKARGEFHGDVVDTYRRMAHGFEKELVSDGYVVIKFFVHVSRDAQRKRLKRLRSDPNTAWRVSDGKLAQVKHYKEAYALYDRLLEATNFDFAPWTLVNGEDRLAANMRIAETLVEAIEHALAAQPDEAALAAQAKAAANAAQASCEVPAAEAPAEGDGWSQAALDEAHRQHSQAPRGSRYIIMAGYPRIDHSRPKPVLEPERYKALLKQEQRRFGALELEMYRKRVPLMLMYEGWDAAGKGGNIKRVAQAIDARAYTVFPSPAPTKPELLHPFLWRYWTRLPKAGHVGIYDRSWYGRVLVERVEGFASPEEWARAYDEINGFELQLVQWGAVLLKFWVDITPEEQLRRFEARRDDPAKAWKITDEDWRNRGKYPQYKQAVDDMFRLTSTEFAPWTVLESDDKRYARVQALRIVNDALEARLRGGGA